ncbi:uncharacterized protein LOC126700672 [Quercus robur]|uniref:uncharacterized protein LOC126700672 n=1 Tax=Quercus robur TaxID=38942 RepID=UPI002163C1B1|nr:uncharacterized protein LOC126700672 [Quercus robur]
MECEFSVRERSLEEEAELQRSTKKVKEAAMGSAFRTNVSYKDKLVGEMPGAFAQAFNLNAEETVSDEPRMDVEGLHNGLLAVTLSSEMRKQIRSKWAFALIVKVVGRTVGFHFLRNRVMSLWKPTGRLDCVDLGKDYFLMRFGLVEDYNNVLNGGPWFIGENFLSLRRWEPNFKPTKASCSLVAVWIRLPELPFEYYELAALKEIGNAIGPVLRIDSNTASEARGRYARICVQIDLGKPLINQILLEGLVQEIQYEGVRSLCFACGRVGHRKEGCPQMIKAPTMEAHGEAESLNVENVSAGEGDQVSQEAGKADEEGKSEFGPWMLVRKRNVRPNNKGSRAGYHGQDNSPSSNHAMTSGVYAQSSKAPPDRSVYGMAQRGVGSSRRDGRDVVGSVGSRQGVVPSAGRSVGSSQLPNQQGCVVTQPPLPPFEFGSGSSPQKINSDGKEPLVGKGSKEKIRNSDSAEAKRSGRQHGSRSKVQMGNLEARKSAGFVAKDVGVNQSQSNDDLGLVQQRRDGSLEVHLPGDTSKHPRGLSALDRSGMDGVGPPLVDISIGQTNQSRGKDFRVESSVAAISGAKLERIKPGGRLHGKENVDCRSRGSEVLGKRDFHGSGQGRPSILQSVGQLSGASIGDPGAHAGCGGRGRIAQETAEGDGMEVSAQVGDFESA